MLFFSRRISILLHGAFDSGSREPSERAHASSEGVSSAAAVAFIAYALCAAPSARRGGSRLTSLSCSSSSHSSAWARARSRRLVRPCSSAFDPAGKPQWQNYVDALESGPFGVYLRNTITVTLATLMCQTLTVIPVAYAAV